MTLRGITFLIVAVVSALVCARVALVPIGILFGKVPQPEVHLIAKVAVSQSLPIFLPGAILWVGALIARARKGYGWQPLALLIAAPCASVVAMFLVFR